MGERAAIGTIAEMMVREQDNIEIIGEGMETRENSWRPGVRAFFGLQELAQFPNIESKLQKMISILNVRDVENGYPASFRILSSDSEKEVILIAQRLLKVHELRRQERDRLLVKVRNSISEKKNESIVFEGGEDFEYILLGGLASIISQEEKKPTFMYRKIKKECVGSVRAP